MNQFEFEKLVVKFSNGANGDVHFVFVGDVDEQFDHQRLPRFKNHTIHFDLSGIEHFNSCGIREWIYFIRDYIKLGCTVFFDRCSVAVVDQVNMVPDTATGVIITSFAAPYFCSDHGEIIKELSYAENLNKLSSHLAPEARCPHCNKELEFDALEESYFLFVESGLIGKVS